MKFLAYLAAVFTWIINFFVVLGIVLFIHKNGVGWGLIPMILVEALLYLLLIFEHRYILKNKARKRIEDNSYYQDEN